MTHGGKRPGAGRKHGARARKTLDREAAQAYVSERVRALIERVTGSYLESAIGLMVLCVKDKSGQWKRVTDHEAIERVLNSPQVNGKDYYYIACKDPNPILLMDILNRELGKPADVHKIQTEPWRPLFIMPPDFKISIGPPVLEPPAVAVVPSGNGAGGNGKEP